MNILPATEEEELVLLFPQAEEKDFIKEEENDFAVNFIIVTLCTYRNPFNPLSDILLPIAPPSVG